MNIRFGLDNKKGLTGADLYLKIFQVSSLLAAGFILLTAVYPPAMTSRNLFTALFSLGLLSLPKWEAILLSYLYRITASEIAVYFVMLITALAAGLLLKRQFQADKKAAKTIRVVLATLIGADLLFRLIPAGNMMVFGMTANISGFIIRLFCLILLIKDLKAK